MSYAPGANTDSQGQAVLVGNPVIYNMPPPASYAGSVTYLNSDIIGGIVVHNTSGGSVNGTLPTAALLVAAVRAIVGSQLAVGACVECLIINGGTAGTITLLTGTGGSFDTNQVGGQAIITGTSKYITIRLTNITVGSEAYTVYS